MGRRRSTRRATRRAWCATCATRTIDAQAVDRIIDESGPNAIIMLQADEGPFPARYQDDEWGFKWRDATDELEEKFGILFAMRVPDADLSRRVQPTSRRSTRSA